MIFGWKKDPHWVMVKRELQKEKMERIGRIFERDRVLGNYKYLLPDPRPVEKE